MLPVFLSANLLNRELCYILSTLLISRIFCCLPDDNFQNKGILERESVYRHVRHEHARSRGCTNSVGVEEEDIFYMFPPDNKSEHMQQGLMTLHHIISLQQYCLSVDTPGTTPKAS